MNSLLQRWGQRAMGQTAGLKPRIPSRFETTHEGPWTSEFPGITEITEEISAETPPTRERRFQPESQATDDSPPPSNALVHPDSTPRKAQDSEPDIPLQQHGEVSRPRVGKKTKPTPLPPAKDRQPNISKSQKPVPREEEKHPARERPHPQRLPKVSQPEPSDKHESQPTRELSEKRFRSLESELQRLRQWMRSESPAETGSTPEIEEPTHSKSSAETRSRAHPPALSVPDRPPIPQHPIPRNHPAPVEVNIGTIVVRAHMQKKPASSFRASANPSANHLANYLARRSADRS